MTEKVAIIYVNYLDEFGNVKIGGIETYITSLSNAFVKNNVTPIIFQPYYKNEVFHLNGIQIICLKVDNIDGILSEVPNYINSSDLIIFAGDQYSKKISTHKTICIQHGIYWDLPLEKSGIRGFLLQYKLIEMIYRLKRFKSVISNFNNSDYKVCVDYNFINWLRTITNVNNEETITVIPNFSKCIDKKAVADKLNTKRDKLKILFARRFEEYRGVNLFLNIAEKLVNIYPNVEIHFAGSGPGKEKIECLIKKFPDRVFITKYESSEVLSFTSQYDISVIPSIGSEGTSLSAIEAMSSATCVVSSNVGGLTNIIIDGYNGYICQPTEDSFFKRISMLIDNPEKIKETSEVAYNLAISSFSLTRWEKSWINLYNMVKNEK
ncbi:glycosyltransferase family 4 protein [Pseudoalteromonas sp. Hal273]